MLTEKDYCDYDTCVALKDLGYKVPTSAYYMPNNNQLIFVSNPFRGGYAIDCFYSHNSFPKEVMTANYIDAPTTWEAHKFLREEKGLHIEIDRVGCDWQVSVIETKNNLCLAVKNRCQTYEEALSEGIKEAIKILAIC